MSTTLDHAVAAPAKGRLWTGRILTGLIAAFLLLDVAMKIAPPPSVRAQAAQMGFASGALAGIGVALLVSLVLYLVPRTSVLGAILLTGYLGGAVATNLHSGMGVGLILFPAVVGVVVWAGLWLREPRLRMLIPLRRLPGNSDASHFPS